MPLPPTVIAIKRKLQEEPLDLLYVQNERSGVDTGDVKRRPAEHSYKFIRVRTGRESTDRPPFTPLRLATANGSHKDVLPSSDSCSDKRVVANVDMSNSTSSPQPVENLGQTSDTHLAPPSTLVLRSSSPRRRVEPRRFLLIKERLANSSTGRISPRHGVQKRKIAGRNELAVFKEQTLSKLASVPRGREVTTQGEDFKRRELRPQDSMSSLKRPGATPQERKWRAENWTQNSERRDRSASPFPPTKQVPKNAAEESLRLASALQQFALQATAEQPSFSDGGSPSKDVEKTPLSSASDAQLDVVEDDEGYVYDQYMRHSVVSDNEGHGDESLGIERSEPGDLAQHDLSPRNGAIGFLVIREEDKADWAALGDTGDSDSDDGYEEDEDSNAESYYGNDYPEDELSSDDELGRGAYVYRQSRSSDEEYDLANEAWSEDDEVGENLDRDWKKGFGVQDVSAERMTVGKRGGGENDDE